MGLDIFLIITMRVNDLFAINIIFTLSKNKFNNKTLEFRIYSFILVRLVYLGPYFRYAWKTKKNIQKKLIQHIKNE